MATMSELTAAAAAGDLPKVRALVAGAPSLLEGRDEEGATALHHAALHARQDVVRYLVAQGGDVNARDDRFQATPAGWAIEYLRELGGCLGMEIDDVLAAIRQGDAGWLGRFLARTPALARCRDREGKPLREHAEASRRADIRSLFQSPADGTTSRPERGPGPLPGPAGKRLVADCRIRSYEPGDARPLWEAARESVTEVYPWLAWCHAAYSMEEAHEWIRSRAALAAEGREHTFAIVGADGRFLGGCGLNQINPLHRFANLGYWVRTSATRRGIAREAVRQVADFAFRNTDLVRLEIVCAVGNTSSQRVAEGAGAVREGTLRHRLLIHGRPVDAVIYGIVRGRDLPGRRT